ncbi:beta-class carbonic anhydrase [Virgibacillus sediminis]|uniref:carbonic anhydrase n=1 Tax=Virgibacillus sediminis TaxID=202260 RepID=A0ABV7A4N4_9BACI
MMNLDEMLAYNEQFVSDKEYQAYQTDGLPNKRTVIFSCMDTRLLELLPKALNLKNGDVKMVKNAGAVIRDPFDSTMKSILVAIYNLQAEQVMVIGHHDCGMSKMDVPALEDKMKDRGVSEDTLATLSHSGIDLEEEFRGFRSVEESVEQSAEIIRNHPLLPEGVKVHGLAIDPETGKLDLVTRDK